MIVLIVSSGTCWLWGYSTARDEAKNATIKKDKTKREEVIDYLQ